MTLGWLPKRLFGEVRPTHRLRAYPAGLAGSGPKYPGDGVARGVAPWKRPRHQCFFSRFPPPLWRVKLAPFGGILTVIATAIQAQL